MGGQTRRRANPLLERAMGDDIDVAEHDRIDTAPGQRAQGGNEVRLIILPGRPHGHRFKLERGRLRCHQFRPHRMYRERSPLSSNMVSA